MADKADMARRFGTLAMASIFLITSVAFTGIIFWQSRNESNAPGANEQEAIEKALNQTDNTGEQNMSQGTIDNFTPSSDAVNELQSTDLVVGTGEEVKTGATVTAHYTGAYVSNGEIFDSSIPRGEPSTFSLDGVIAGWTQGVPGMKVGGKRRLVIPGNLAYGEAPEGYTPGSSGRPLGPLVFDIEITAVTNN